MPTLSFFGNAPASTAANQLQRVCDHIRQRLWLETADSDVEECGDKSDQDTV